MMDQKSADHATAAGGVLAVMRKRPRKTHVAHLLAKLGVRDRLQAVVCAFDAGLA